MNTTADQRRPAPVKRKIPRVGGYNWEKARPKALAVYNAAYSPSGNPLPKGDKPWTVIGPTTWETFATWDQAINYAFREVEG